MDRCTGSRDITEILLKTALNAIHSIKGRLYIWFQPVICQNTTRPRLLTTLKKKKAFENIVGKGENAGYQYYLLFP